MKTNEHFSKVNITLILCVFIFTIFTASAVTTTWNGGSTNWSTGANWDNGVPSSSDDAVIPNTGTNPTLTTGSVCQSLAIAASASVSTAGFSLTVSGDVTGSGTLIAGGSSTITISGSMTISNFTANTSTVILTASAPATLSALTFYDLQVNLSTTNVTTSASLTTVGHNLSLGGTSTTLKMGGPLTVTGDLTIASGEALNFNGERVLIVGGNATGAGGLDFTGTGTLKLSGNLSITGLVCGASTNGKVIMQGTSQTIGPASSAVTICNLKIGNGGTTSVTIDATPLTIDDTLTGTSSGTLVLGTGTNLEADLFGDIQGSFTISPGTGLVNLQGQDHGSTPRAQSITGQTFYDLWNNNTNTTIASGTVTVQDNLDLQAGDIILNGNNLTISSGAAGAGAGAGAAFAISSGAAIDLSYTGSAGYIVTDGTAGVFTMDNDNSTTYPVGHSTSTYNPILLSSTATTNAVRVDNVITDHTNTAVTDHVVQVTWQVTPTATSTMTETVQWKTSQELGTFDNANSAISWRTATNQYWTQLGSTGTSSGSNPWNHIAGATLSMTGTQLYYIAMGDNTNPLPVSLINFQAAYNTGAVNLDWTTASEINNNYFEIQRSANGNNWIAIGKVDGHGNSMEINHYNAQDNLAGIVPNGNIYYRLKQVDFNGAFTYSDIRTVTLNNLPMTVGLYPNPASSCLNVDWTNATDENAVLRVVNINGVELYREAISGKGDIHKQIDMISYPAGTYYVQIVSDKSSISKTVYKN